MVTKAQAKKIGLIAVVCLGTIAILNRAAPTNPVKKIVNGQ